MSSLKKLLLLCFFVLNTGVSQVFGLSFPDFFTPVYGESDESSTTREIRDNIQTLDVFKSGGLTPVFSPGNLTPKIFSNETDTALRPGEDNFFQNENELANQHEDTTTYIVKKGDNIYAIAAYFQMSPETILTNNKKTSISLSIGEKLEIPNTPGIFYDVKRGDTIASIAKKYNIDADDIALYNGLLLDDELDTDSLVYLPGAIEKAKPKSEKVVIKDKTTKSGKSGKDTILVSKYIPRSWERGDTSHLNTPASVKKYMSLPKYPGYYIYPAPGTTRTQKLHGHNGSDFAGPVGTPVYAAAGGVVRVAKNSGYNFGYGNYIIVRHANGSETIYAHLSSVSVQPGQQVSQGQVIGAVGSSGNSTGPHLHFEIRGAYNPWAW